jgi:hypothetical protein
MRDIWIVSASIHLNDLNASSSPTGKKWKSSAGTRSPVGTAGSGQSSSPFCTPSRRSSPIPFRSTPDGPRRARTRLTACSAPPMTTYSLQRGGANPNPRTLSRPAGPATRVSPITRSRRSASSCFRLATRIGDGLTEVYPELCKSLSVQDLDYHRRWLGAISSAGTARTSTSSRSAPRRELPLSMQSETFVDHPYSLVNRRFGRETPVPQPADDRWLPPLVVARVDAP